MRQALEIKENTLIDSSNEENPAIVTISCDGEELLRRKISIKQSKVGVLETRGETSFLIVFRVINSLNNSFSIYNKNEHHIKDFQITQFIEKQLRFETFHAEDRRFHSYLRRSSRILLISAIRMIMLSKRSFRILFCRNIQF